MSRVLDYVRIVGISETEAVSESTFDVTFNILYSKDSDFSSPRRGVFTIRLSELIDISDSVNRDIENMALGLVGQILIREKREDGSVNVLHLLGMELGDWLIKSARINLKH